jgi:quaternary ammonium compound-resistance protein SugE
MIAFLSMPILAWPMVILAVIIEVAWFVVLKKADGFSVYPWNYLQFVLLVIDTPLLSFALKSLPTGTVYATWTGAAAASIAVIGILYLGDTFSLWRISFIALIIIGIVGLQLSN